MLLASLVVATRLPGPTRSAAAPIELPEWNRAEPIAAVAQAANVWQEGSYEVWLLRGDCRITQGDGSASCREAVLWIDRAKPTEVRPSRVVAYLEGDVQMASGGGPAAPRLTDQTFCGELATVQSVDLKAARVAGRPDVLPAIYCRADARRNPPPPGAIRRTQFLDAAGQEPLDGAVPPGKRRIRVFPRGEVPVQAQWFPEPQGEQWIAVIDSGVNLIVDGLPGFGSIDVLADRLVIWTKGLEEPDLTGQRAQDESVPLEVYMEGNIVFRQGERVVYADRMYYNVQTESGIVLGAEVLSPAQEYEGLLRFQAELVQQAGRGRFFARNAFITSSLMGRPGYRVQSGDIYFEDIQSPVFDPWTGQPEIDPETGEPAVEHKQLATSRGNTLFVGPVPVLWWPTLATDLKEPTFYLRRIRFKNDNVFGWQALTDWNMYELLGIRRRPENTEWDASLDLMSERGVGHGTTFLYGGQRFLGLEGPVRGLADYWGIKDDGLDNLGLGRRGLEPEKEYRYRLFWQHRQILAGDYQLTAEVGWLSDRNFLQEYFQREWDELKDRTTGISLKHAVENRSWDVMANVHLNDFFTETEWLPRADHFWLGQSLFAERLTWFEHSSAGYGRFRKLTPPGNPNDQPFSFLPWEESSRQGERLATRQEIDLPLQLGPVRLVPYALGELAHWGEDIQGNDLQRAYWQAGARASMPMWRVDPTVENQLLNLHGLAHKVVFDAEFAFAEANRNLNQLPLYDPIDDFSIEAARRRFATLTFGSPSLIPPVVETIPPQFDPRFYAVRTGMAGWVTAPSTEIADDLTTLRLGMSHRWQTKRGMPGNRRIVDWLTLETNITWFPDKNRDNFGTAFGLLDYDLRWHVGDRLTLVSDGIFDFFYQGQHVVTVGGYLTRPPRGSLYLGMRVLEGPIHTEVIALSYSYWMSPKWISTFGMSVDLGSEGNIGQNLSIVRVGESLLVSAGLNVDGARDSVGVSLIVEPRFLPKGRLRNIGGAQIPVAGAQGLE